MPQANQHYRGTQSAVRAIRILKLFGGQQTDWSLSDIVSASGLNKTTAFRLLSALESEGLLERTENGSYCLGSEMMALGGRAIMSNNLRKVAEPILTGLMESTGERTTLEQPIINGNGDTEMLMVLEVQGKHLISINQFIGSRLPIHATSTGKALLAFMPVATQALILQQTFARLTGQTIIDKAQLEAELTEIRQRGYAVALGELEAGLMATGAPVWNYSGEPIAAISIEGPNTRINEPRLHELGTLIKQAASDISFRLGYRCNERGINYD